MFSDFSAQDFRDTNLCECVDVGGIFSIYILYLACTAQFQPPWMKLLLVIPSVLYFIRINCWAQAKLEVRYIIFKIRTEKRQRWDANGIKFVSVKFSQWNILDLRIRIWLHRNSLFFIFINYTQQLFVWLAMLKLKVIILSQSAS